MSQYTINPPANYNQDYLGISPESSTSNYLPSMKELSNYLPSMEDVSNYLPSMKGLSNYFFPPSPTSTKIDSASPGFNYFSPEYAKLKPFTTWDTDPEIQNITSEAIRPNYEGPTFKTDIKEGLSGLGINNWQDGLNAVSGLASLYSIYSGSQANDRAQEAFNMQKAAYNRSVQKDKDFATNLNKSGLGTYSAGA